MDDDFDWLRFLDGPKKEDCVKCAGAGFWVKEKKVKNQHGRSFQNIRCTCDAGIDWKGDKTPGGVKFAVKELPAEKKQRLVAGQVATSVVLLLDYPKSQKEAEEALDAGKLLFLVRAGLWMKVRRVRPTRRGSWLLWVTTGYGREHLLTVVCLHPKVLRVEGTELKSLKKKHYLEVKKLADGVKRQETSPRSLSPKWFTIIED